MISLCQSFILSTVNLKAVKFLQLYVINILLLLDVIKDTLEHLNLYHRQLLRQYDKETQLKLLKVTHSCFTYIKINLMKFKRN